MALLDRVTLLLEGQGWDVEADDDSDGGLLLTPTEGLAGWPVIAQVDEEAATVAVYSVLPEQTPLEHREAMAAFVTVVNYGLVVGSFEIDLEDGDVQVRTSLAVAGVDLDDTQLGGLLERLVGANLAAMDLWFDPLSAVASGHDPATLLEGAGDLRA